MITTVGRASFPNVRSCRLQRAVAKGFAIWDLAPGHYVLTSSGGTVTDLDGVPLTLDYHLDTLADINSAMNGRQTFIAAGSTALAREIADLLT